MPYQEEALNQLIINKLSQDQYNALSAEGPIPTNQLYFIEASGNIDAASGTIENVADPINNTDAANKQYVDNSIIEYSEDSKSYTDFEVSKKFSEVCYELAYINPSNSNYNVGSGYKGFITILSSYTNSFIPDDVTVHAISVSSEGNDTTVVDSYLSIFEITVNNIEEAINLNSLDNYIYVGSSLNTNDVDGNPTEFIYVFNNIVLNKNKIYLFAFTSENDLSKYNNVDIFKDKLVGTRLKLLNGQSSESRMISTINTDTGIPTFRTDALIPIFKFYYNIKYNIDFVSSHVTDLSNLLSSYALSSDVNSISSLLNDDITYVSSQVSGIPPTITSLSSTVSSNYALKTEIPTPEDLGLSNYSAVSTVTDLSNSLSGYSPKSDVTYVSSQVSSLLPTINDLTSTVEGIDSTVYNGGTTSTGIYTVGTIGAIPTYTPDNTDPIRSDFFVRPADSINTAIYTTVLTNTTTNEQKLYEISSSQFADVLSAGKIIASRDYVNSKAASISSKTVFGDGAYSTRYGISIGSEAYSDDAHSIAIGNSVSAQTGISIGTESKASNNSISIGSRATSTNRGIAIGVESGSLNHGVAIGYETSAVSGTVAIGYETSASHQLPISIKGYYKYDEDIPISSVTLSVTSAGILNINNNEVAFKSDIPDISNFDLSDYAAVSTVTNLSNSLSGYATTSDITSVSSQVSGLLPTVNDLTSTTENINNNLSSFVPYSTSSTLKFTPVQGIQYGTISANADGISSYFTGEGNTGSLFNSFSLIGSASPKLRFWSLYEESDFGEVLVSDLNETIYENGSITYNDNQLVFPEESGTFVVDSQLSAYSLKSEVQTISANANNKLSSYITVSQLEEQVSALMVLINELSGKLQ